MKDIILLFNNKQYANPLSESRQAVIEQYVSDKTGAKCIVMPNHISGATVAGDILLLQTCHSYSQGGQYEDENKLSTLTGMKCVLLDPHISGALMIRSAE